jgi:hypothetical protein
MSINPTATTETSSDLIKITIDILIPFKIACRKLEGDEVTLDAAQEAMDFLTTHLGECKEKYRSNIYPLRRRRTVRPSSLNASAPLVYQTSKPEFGRIRLNLDTMLSLLFVSSVSVRKQHAASQRMPSSLKLPTRTVVPSSSCALADV